VSTAWVPRGPACVKNAQLGQVTHAIDGLGRGVCSGRVAAIGLSPDGRTIYAGAASGGVWRSRDDGAHWLPLMDDQPTLSVGAIAVARNGVVYVGTGEYNDSDSGAGVMTGVGILRSDTDGRVWELLWHAQLARTRIARIVVHPTRPDELYAATSVGLFVATDRTSFHLFELGVPGAHECTDVAVDFTDPDAPIVYAGFLDNGIHKLTGTPLDTSKPVADRFVDLGAMPPTRFPGMAAHPWFLRISLAIAEPPHASTLYAAFSDEYDLIGLYRSTDGGAHWDDYGTSTFGATGMGTWMLVLAVDPADPDLVFYGDTRLWRREGPAAAWQLMSAHRGDYQGVHDDQHALVFDRTDPSVVWLGNDGGVYKSVDRGRHFYPRNRGLATGQLYSLAQFSGEPAILLAGTQDLGAISTRGHPAWTELFGGDGFGVAIEPAAPRNWYAGYDPNRAPMYRYTADDRFAGKVVANGLGVSPEGLSTVAIAADPDTAGLLYLATRELFWTRNHADRWELIGVTARAGNTSQISAIAIAPSDPRIVYYAHGNELARIQRTGDTWTGPVTSIAIPTPGFDEKCAALAVDPHDPDVVYAVVGTLTGPDADDIPLAHRIYRAEFDGTVLDVQPFTDLPDEPLGGGVVVTHELNHVNAIALDPAHPGVIYVGTDIGVYRWGGTAPWERFSTNLPAAAVVTAMELHADSRRLRVSTLGRGVWECLLDAPPRTVDLYVRDCELDDGARPTAGERQHPITRGVLRWNAGADIKVDTERMLIGGFASPSTVGYDGTGGVDYLGFEALGSDSARGGAESRVYVQVHNRGPAKAGEVDVRLFWARKDGDAFPDLPPDFWARHLGDTFDTAHWKPLGPAQKIIDLEPASPRVARFDWTASGSNDTIGILAVVSSTEDPLPAGLTLAVETAARTDKRVALRECDVDPATYKLVLGVLAVIGLVVLVAVEGPKLV
jgi:hypothetical protein